VAHWSCQIIATWQENVVFQGQQIAPTKTLTQQQVPHQMPAIVQETPMTPSVTVAETALQTQMVMEYVM
jgi:hypothetical protein